MNIIDDIPKKPWEQFQPMNSQESVLGVIQQSEPTSMVSSYSNQPTIQTPSFYSNSYNPMINYHHQAPFYNNSSLPDHFLPSGSSLGMVEQKIRGLLNSLTSLIRTFGSISHMLDSTIYAAWSSMMAVIAVGEQFRYFKQEHLRYWLGLIKSCLKSLLQLFGRNNFKGQSSNLNKPEKGTRSFKIILPASIGLVLYILWRSLHNYYQTKALIPARALYEYDPSDSSCLAALPGDDLLIEDPQDAEWVYCKNVRSGLEGFIPINYIKKLESRQ